MSESYKGIKFKTVIEEKVAPSHPAIKELRKWCQIFHEKELAPPYTGGSYGNLSFRVDNDQFIITGSCIGLKNELHDDCFVHIEKCDNVTETVHIKGTRNPSSETMMHAAIYAQRKDINAVFHGHCPDLLANAESLRIPITLVEKPYGTLQMVEEVLKVSSQNDFFIIRNHGFVALGKIMEEAGNACLNVLNKTR